MKKVLLSLFLAIVCIPMAMSQAFDGRHIETTSETTCSPYLWPVTGVTYSHDTTVLYVSGDTVYVLDLIVRTASTDTTEVVDTAACVYKWNDSVWKTPGIHIGTLHGSDGCDSVVRINLTLNLVDSSNVDTVVCDSIFAPWGEILTTSLSCDSTWITAEGCQRHDVVNIVIGHSSSSLDIVDANCSYRWNGYTFTDTAVHTLHKYTTVGHCDSIISVKGNLTFLEVDSIEATACGGYMFFNDSLTTSNVYVHNEVNASCTTRTVLNLTVNPVYLDNTNLPVRDVTAGCFYKWGDSTFTDTNVVHTAIVRTVDGCDSLGSIRIIGYTNVEEDILDTAYCGDVFTWMGRQFTDACTYDSTTVADGCTTNHHLILTKTYRYDTLAEVARCASYTHQFNSRTGDGFSRYSVTFTTSGLHVTDPNYEDPDFPNTNLYSKEYGTGCITFHALPLTIVNPEQLVRPDVDTVACDSYTFKVGKGSYAVTRTFTADVDTTIVAHNWSTARTTPCFDSIATLHLVIHHRTNVDTNVTACDSFYWDFNETTYMNSITVSKVDTSRVNDEGCYYYGRLNLTIHRTPEVHIAGDWMLEHGQSTTLHAVSTSNNLQYKWYKGNETTVIGNDSTITIDDPQDGNNQTIHLVSNVRNQNCPTDSWITITYNNLGIEGADEVAMDIYPNPTSRIVNLNSATAISQVTIYNAIGQQVMASENGGNAMQLDLGNLAAGNYTMRITAADGSQTARKLIVSK